MKLFVVWGRPLLKFSGIHQPNLHLKVTIWDMTWDSSENKRAQCVAEYYSSVFQSLANVGNKHKSEKGN